MKIKKAKRNKFVHSFISLENLGQANLLTVLFDPHLCKAILESKKLHLPCKVTASLKTNKHFLRNFCFVLKSSLCDARPARTKKKTVLKS